MKILHVIRDLSRATGGPVNALKGLTEAQAALGHEVSIVTSDDGRQKIIPDNVEIHFVKTNMSRRSRCFGFKERLQKVIPDVDILHAHMVWDYPILEAARQANRLGKPFVLRPCGNLEFWSVSQKRLKKALYWSLFGSELKGAAVVHFTSDEEQTNSESMIKGCASVVIPLGVLPEMVARADPNALARRFPELGRKRIVLFLGRLHPKKQPELLLEAFAPVALDDLDLHLVLAGPADDNYLDSLKSRVRLLSLEKRVSFLGLLDHDAVREAYAAAAVFVLPSHQENFGIAVVEAMAACCPVIISDKVGVAADVERAGAGIVIPLEQASISQALRKILSDANLRRGMGENGHRLVLSTYTWPHVATRVLRTYEEVIAIRAKTVEELK